MGRVQIINITSGYTQVSLLLTKSNQHRDPFGDNYGHRIDARHARLKPVDERRLDARERWTCMEQSESLRFNFQTFFRYSGAPLIRTLTGQRKLAVITGFHCSINFLFLLCFIAANITFFFILKTRIS